MRLGPKPLRHNESSAPMCPHATDKGNGPLRTLRAWLDNHNTAGLSRRLDRLERLVNMSNADFGEQITEIADELAELQAQWSEKDDVVAIKLEDCVDRLRDMANRAGE
jgi:hypothetical protein